VRKSIGGHVNRIVELSQGALILTAAGDDISFPERTLVTYEAWEYTKRAATSLHSGIIQINSIGAPVKEVFNQGQQRRDSGRVIEQKASIVEYVRTLEPLIYGCANAFARELYKVFGNLPDEVIHEDNALGFRSLLAGRVFYIDRPLVKYRVHDDNIYISSRAKKSDLESLTRHEERTRHRFANREIMYRGFQKDLKTARTLKLLTQGELDAANSEAVKLENRSRLMRRFFEEGLFGRFQIFWRLKRDGLSGDQLRVFAHRLLPRPLHLGLSFVRAQIASLLG
jgi:hypothetical protein